MRRGEQAEDWRGPWSRGCGAEAVSARLVPGPGVRRAEPWPECEPRMEEVAGLAVDRSACSGAAVPGESLSRGAGWSWEERSLQCPQSPRCQSI